MKLVIDMHEFKNSGVALQIIEQKGFPEEYGYGGIRVLNRPALSKHILFLRGRSTIDNDNITFSRLTTKDAIIEWMTEFLMEIKNISRQRAEKSLRVDGSIYTWEI